MSNKKIYYEYDFSTETSVGIEYEKYLYQCQSKYQKIEVLKTKYYGNAMYLDGCFMLSEKNQNYYHEECIKIVPKNAKKILIIGGGDCGIAKLILNKLFVNKIDVVEIDKQVVDASKKYFSNNFNYKKSDKNKINIIVEDGYKFLKTSQEKYNCIIIDSTDPVNQAKVLFSKRFLQKCYISLTKMGVIIQQSGSPLKDTKTIINPLKRKYKDLGFINNNVTSFSMPLYPTGTWSFMSAKRA